MAIYGVTAKYFKSLDPESKKNYRTKLSCIFFVDPYSQFGSTIHLVVTTDQIYIIVYNYIYSCDFPVLSNRSATRIFFIPGALVKFGCLVNYFC